MAKGFSKKQPSKKTNAFIAGMAWRIEKIKSGFSGNKPLITRESVAIAGRQSLYDNDKLMNALPEFRFRSLEDSIYEACAKYLENMQKAEGIKPKA